MPEDALRGTGGSRHETAVADQKEERTAERWGKLTDDDWKTVDGKKDQLVGRIQERYGLAKEEAEKQADEWSRALKHSEREIHAASRR